MSAKNEKRKRQAARAELGISKQAERDQRAFDAEVARLRHRLAVEHEAPIVRRDNRRRSLALAGLLIVALVLAVFLLGLR